ncbi:amino acid transporter [Punctularia strigosozonata HHB-11173 SS5]|uniref:Amino acid transporter n=1 Tax=Punctularia strigosozonata (strain HHB-11173) TaxID=741275 RepID=R7S1X0_PUNST|nr:amino acid transporter [Punctularia strigosozonata HHB-11173 SS5]EIN03859.1 amino acid transporter [Punctularia strigosozonata HHB-11173 SS5]
MEKHGPGYQPGTTVEVTDATDDDAYLEQMGYKQEFRRDFTFLGLFSLVSSELAVLPGVAGTIWYTMGYMGLIGMTWGWLVAAVMGQFLVYSLAELSSAYPTSGGLYYWAYMTASPRWRMLSCYVVAWSMIISTPLACVSITYSAAQLLVATVQVGLPDYEPASWHIYLVYLAMMFASYLVICLPTRYVSWFNIWAYFIGTIVLIIVTILLPIKADHLNSAKDIFTKGENQIAWPAGWSFCMTFLSATWTLSGYDVAAHVAEETHNAAITVPRAMVWSTWSSAFLGFVYLISLALCATDIDSLMANPLGQPVGTLMADVLGTKGGIALMTINAFTQFACGVAFFVAASRIFFAYSRDKALPFSDWLSRVSPRTQTPNNASLVVFILSAAFGVISVGSDTAFEAFFSGSTLAGQIGYILPVLGRCLYENNPEYRNGPYNLGRYSRAIRWTAVAWNAFIMPLVSL